MPRVIVSADNGFSNIGCSSCGGVERSLREVRDDRNSISGGKIK
jgi:hypothetical protein